MSQSKDNFTKLLKDHGFKVTPGRILILTVLAAEEKPLPVSEIEIRMRGKLNSVTLYRALEALALAGIIRRVDLGHGHAHYELEKEHHHHLVCKDCGKIEDIPEYLPQGVEKQVLGNSSKFKSIYSHNLEFFGLCFHCSK